MGANNQEELSRKKFFIIGVVLMVVFFARAIVFDVAFLGDNSMEPTISSTEYAMVNRLSYVFGQPQLGDIASVRLSPRRAETPIIRIRRIIAKENQTVQIINGQLYIDGEAMEEVYISEQSHADYGPVTIPSGHYFVLSDNRNDDTDSRSEEIGFVEANALRGKALMIMWPTDSLRSL